MLKKGGGERDLYKEAEDMSGFGQISCRMCPAINLQPYYELWQVLGEQKVAAQQVTAFVYWWGQLGRGKKGKEKKKCWKCLLYLENVATAKKKKKNHH